MSDPRVKWEDAETAVLDCEDIPEGVMRTPNCAIVADAAQQPVTFSPRPNYHTGKRGYYSKVLKADLPWLATQLPPASPRYNAVYQREVPPPKVVKEWPHPCPRCGKAESMVILFSSVKCRNGCFA